MPDEKKISTARENLQLAFAATLSIGLWFLLMPETYWERAATTGFCSILLVLIYTFPYLRDKKLKK